MPIMNTLAIALMLATPTPTPSQAPSSAHCEKAHDTANASTCQDADERADRGMRGGARILVYDPDEVEGDRLSPEGTHIDAKQHPHHANLIRVRTTFLPELIRVTRDI